MNLKIWFPNDSGFVWFYMQTGAVQFVPLNYEWSGSVFSEAQTVYLLRSCICSEALSLEQFYQFRSTLSGGILLIPMESKWNCYICSLPTRKKSHSQTFAVDSWTIPYHKWIIETQSYTELESTLLSLTWFSLHTIPSRKIRPHDESLNSRCNFLSIKSKLQKLDSNEPKI